MSPKKIQVGKTYLGRDGRRQTVTHVVDIAGTMTVYLIDHRNQDRTNFVPLSRFAHWAVREVDDTEMQRVKAEREKHHEKFLAAQRREAKRNKQEE